MFLYSLDCIGHLHYPWTDFRANSYSKMSIYWLLTWGSRQMNIHLRKMMISGFFSFFSFMYTQSRPRISYAWLTCVSLSLTVCFIRCLWLKNKYENCMPMIFLLSLVFFQNCDDWRISLSLSSSSLSTHSFGTCHLVSVFQWTSIRWNSICTSLVRSLLFILVIRNSSFLFSGIDHASMIN